MYTDSIGQNWVHIWNWTAIFKTFQWYCPFAMASNLVAGFESIVHCNLHLVLLQDSWLIEWLIDCCRIRVTEAENMAKSVLFAYQKEEETLKQVLIWSHGNGAKMLSSVRLSVCLSVFFSVCLPSCLSSCLSICQPDCLRIYLFVSICLSARLSICLFIYESVCYSFSLSGFFTVCF